MITKTNAIGNADGKTWAASNRLRYLGAPSLLPGTALDGDNSVFSSVFSMVAQVQGGIPPRGEPH